MGGMRTHVRGLLAGLEMLDPPEEIVLFVNRELAPTLDVPFDVVETNVQGSLRPYRYGYEQFVLPWRTREVDIDVLHCPGYSAPLYTDVPTVVTIHDTNYEAIPETFSRFSRLVWKQLVPRVANRAAAILTVSEFSKEEIARHIDIPRSKINVTENAPSPTLPASPPPLDTLDISVEPPYVLYVGSTHPHKNHVSLVRALSSFPDRVSAVFVGPERSAHEEVISLAKSLGVADRVSMPGFVSESELAALYENAVLYVHPSLYEGFGMPVLEAMSYRTPVACSNVASLPEIGDDAVRYFDPTSPEDIAKTCNEILQSEDIQRRLSNHGHDRSKSYSWTQCAKKTLETYRTVLD